MQGFEARQSNHFGWGAFNKGDIIKVKSQLLTTYIPNKIKTVIV